jgi:hypothetical protein
MPVPAMMEYRPLTVPASGKPLHYDRR